MGMSVTNVSGFGRQSGQTEVYRGAEYEVDFIPKTRIDILLDDDLVEVAVDAIESAAHTGEIGDGKVAILPVEDVLRIRTGERGRDAL
jgi:nitrogen regulatory protein P-II 1